MKGQTVEVIKALAALFFFFSTLVVTFFLRMKDKIGPKLTVMLMMGMLAVMGVVLGVIIDWQTLTARRVEQYYKGGEAISAYGLKIKSIDSQQQYLADGDFKVVYTYDVQNTSPANIRYLVPDKGGWFGKDIKQTVEGRILGAKAAFHTLDMSRFSVEERVVGYIKGSPIDMTYLQWRPAVNPPLRPGATLKYSVSISTRGTEKKAFTRKGSYAGIGTDLVADRLTCKIKAPPGKLFRPSPPVLRDSSDATLDSSWLDSEPEFLHDDTEIEWNIERPLPTVNYLVRIVIIDQ